MNPFRIAVVIVGTCVVLGLIAQFAWLGNPSFAIPLSARLAIGGVLLLGGGGLMLAAQRAVAVATREDRSGRLIDHGVFAVTRNPQALGASIVLAGAAFAFNVVAWILAVPVSLVAMQYAIVRPSERRLHARFGAAWSEYAARVSR